MTSTFGNGYFGVGDYGTATPILFTGSMARTGLDSGARFVPLPVLRVAGRPEFRAESRVKRTVRTGPHLASSEFLSRSDFWKGPVLEGRARSDFGGSYYFDQSLPDRETMHLCHGRLGLDAATAWRAVLLQRAAFGRMDDTTGRARTVPWAVLGQSRGRLGFDGYGGAITTQPIKLDASRIALDGLTGPGTVGVAFRRSAAGYGLSGAATAQIWAVSKRHSARTGYTARSSVRAQFVTELDTGRITLRGVARTSYEWSDQTAPGRDPVPSWGGVSDPVDNWAGTGDPGGEWVGVDAPSDNWILIPANADNWQDA